MSNFNDAKRNALVLTIRIQALNNAANHISDSINILKNDIAKMPNSSTEEEVAHRNAIELLKEDQKLINARVGSLLTQLYDAVRDLSDELKPII